MKRYYVKYGHDTDDFADEYEVLFRPDETIVASITEPEDRNFYRDLAPVVAELNKLEDVAHGYTVSWKSNGRQESEDEK